AGRLRRALRPAPPAARRVHLGVDRPRDRPAHPGGRTLLRLRRRLWRAPPPRQLPPPRPGFPPPGPLPPPARRQARIPPRPRPPRSIPARHRHHDAGLHASRFGGTVEDGGVPVAAGALEMPNVPPGDVATAGFPQALIDATMPAPADERWLTVTASLATGTGW